MKHCFRCTLIWLLGFSAFAEPKVPVIKSWRSFRSEVGYELKYPDCWQMEVDDPDEGRVGMSPTAAKHVFVSKTRTCAGPPSSPNVQSGIGIVGGEGSKKTKDEAIKNIEFVQEFAPNNVARKEWLVFKRFQLGSNDAAAWVEVLSSGRGIRWHVRVYCPDWWLDLSGPHILNPVSTYDEKFKKGDLALPEPEKTIIESFRCIPAKRKADPK